ncbi:MAG: 4-hydroxy-3-methylbut-2-enyl diphosphate reductase [Candidatus Neomarinimicrobiota bacterium]|jgi:4-hydroxy-3-methylbut-2-enyl diphosphate reductase|nr:4-hydroxy-3-methylbut-2-enyl diphosphate reductase [Candidatus Neomarinimicrobiota bacterium]
MKILLAKDAGYCFGVRDAVSLAYETAEKEGEVFMLGDIVHNENVVEELEEAGVKVVNSLDKVPDNKPILFRAHGTVPDVWKESKMREMEVVDATCPLVTEIHEEVKKLHSENRKIIIIGDHGHDEVNGIKEQVENAIVVANPEEAMQLRKIKKAGVVSQSTQMIENVQEIINILMTKVFDLRFVNTICFPTRRNHEQIKNLSEICDIMIVIGSFTSANSKRLTELAKMRNERTFQVTSAEDLEIDWFQNSDTVGVSAGASTPDNIINQVLDKIKSIGKVTEEELVYE